jgi:hypothetical protein
MKNATKEPRIPIVRKMAVAKTVPMLVVETLFWIMEKSVITDLPMMTTEKMPVAQTVASLPAVITRSIPAKSVTMVTSKTAMGVAAHAAKKIRSLHQPLSVVMALLPDPKSVMMATVEMAMVVTPSANSRLVSVVMASYKSSLENSVNLLLMM